MHLNFLAFWAINDRLNEAELVYQIHEMKRLGFDGFVWHPRFYPDEPAYLGLDYLSILSEVILEAKSLGLAVWIYDENGWPSGTASGETLRRSPHLKQQWIELVEDHPDDCLAEFQRDGMTWYVARRYGHGVDYLNPELAPAFLELTHERYRDGLVQEAFAYVSAFFCDEPEFGIGHAYDEVSGLGALPWGDHVRSYIQTRHGLDITEYLEDLFFDGKQRQLFIESLTDLFNDGFTAPINDWCKAHGKDFTAHVKGEEHPLFQVAMVGSCQAFFRNLTLPGIDALERHPSGDFFPRQVSSSAWQFGSGRCMVECFGGAGWGASPEDLERYLKWLASHGLTDFVTHLWQYRLKSSAIRDWPASFPKDVTWCECFPEILARVRRYASGLDRSADTLLVAPYRAIMREYVPAEIMRANIHNGSRWPDSPASRLSDGFVQLVDRVQSAGCAWHVTDERTLEEAGVVENGRLKVGRMSYSKVILGGGVELDSDWRKAVESLLVPVPEPLPPVAEPKAALTTLDVEWTLLPGGLNDYVGDVKPLGDGLFELEFHARNGIELRLCFADVVWDVVANGRPMDAAGVMVTLRGRNTLRFRSSDPAPFLSLQGNFLVHAVGGWSDGPSGTRATTGQLLLAGNNYVKTADMVASGYPFRRDPVFLEVSVTMPVDGVALRLAASADAARLWFDGRDLGWGWGPSWSFPLPQEVRGMTGKLRVELIPSSFNTYGPHHHMDGDRPLVSPVQYEYRKNFADRADAPECTRVEAWHTKAFGLAPLLRFEQGEHLRNRVSTSMVNRPGFCQ